MSTFSHCCSQSHQTLVLSLQCRSPTPLTFDSAPPHTGRAGEDGPSQMGLEDLAMFRVIPTATVFYPSDGVSMEKAVELAANTKVSLRW